ncbi:MAG: hypothetical protein ACP5NW_03335 [Candidatus Woesearchaeota archaeon]
MSDLESPEIPLQLAMPAAEEPKKKGFFRRLFSKDKPTSELPEMELPKMDIPSLELSMDNVSFDNSNPRIDEGLNEGSFASLPALPSIPEQGDEYVPDGGILIADKVDNKIENKSLGKHKKGQKRKISKVNESSQFDWNREIQAQEILIHDSNRFNQDVNVLVSRADEHVEAKKPVAKGKTFMSEHKEITPDVEPVNIEESKATPPVQEDVPPYMNMQHHKMFVKLSANHQKLRNQLKKHLSNQTLFNNRYKVTQLIKAYDESVEQHIENMKLELADRKNQLDKREDKIRTQEKNIRDTYKYVKGLDKKLAEKETQINLIISKNVERQLTERLYNERKLLDGELSRTEALNADLKKKIKIMEEDRIKFEREHQFMSESERKKLNELQAVYEKKLKELETERNAFYEEKKIFDSKKKNALELIQKAGVISKNLEELKHLKESVEQSKATIERELHDDTELKDALTAAEAKLSDEKQNLDNLIFSKYLESNLKNIKPEYADKKQDWNNESKSHPLYGQITQCRQLLLQMKMTEAKALYNNIRRAYEQIPNSSGDKEGLYTAIRELYNDIQLKMVEAQIHSK